MALTWFALLLCGAVVPGIRVTKSDESRRLALTGEEQLGAERSTADSFSMCSFGANKCPQGTHITSADVCKRAAASFRLEYQVRVHSDLRPSGCFANSRGKAFFNTHTGRNHNLSAPICAQANAGQPALSPAQFEEWMEYWQNSNLPQGGWACGYGNGWCGCSCGYNDGDGTLKECALPEMQLGTAGGHTCGFIGRLYGCAEAHNTVRGCPAR